MTRWWIWMLVLAVVVRYLYLPAAEVSGGQALGFLVLLLCPLLHFFGMHRGHHGGAESSRSTEEGKPR